MALNADWYMAKTDISTAKADPNDPNADLNVLLGITDK
jgi:hypothetical protein